jgi:MYND finger
MPSHTQKHLTKKERKAQQEGQHKCKNIENALVNVKDARLLCNALIEQGSGNLERALNMLQKFNDHLGTGRHIVACSFCAKKVGIHMCSGCPSTSDIRYCSRECQQAAWPSHKTTCSAHVVVDVD